MRHQVSQTLWNPCESTARIAQCARLLRPSGGTPLASRCRSRSWRMGSEALGRIGNQGVIQPLIDPPSPTPTRILLDLNWPDRLPWRDLVPLPLRQGSGMQGKTAPCDTGWIPRRWRSGRYIPKVYCLFICTGSRSRGWPRLDIQEYHYQSPSARVTTYLPTR